jgi:hypothetical protein
LFVDSFDVFHNLVDCGTNSDLLPPHVIGTFLQAGARPQGPIQPSLWRTIVSNWGAAELAEEYDAVHRQVWVMLEEYLPDIWDRLYQLLIEDIVTLLALT